MGRKRRGREESGRLQKGVEGWGAGRWGGLARFNCELTKLGTHTQTHTYRRAHTQPHLATLIFRSRLTKIHLIPWKLLERVRPCVSVVCASTHDRALVAYVSGCVNGRVVSGGISG